MTEERIKIIGAGVIGLSLALELRARGYGVEVLEKAETRSEGMASWAAAGMLAVSDPYHPAGLVEFAAWSGELYEDFLRRVQKLSGMAVPYQTLAAVEYEGAETREIAERSIDPRQLMVALQAAAVTEGVEIRRGACVVGVREDADEVVVELANGEKRRTDRVVFAGGAWGVGAEQIRPRKGQMLRVRLPEGMVLEKVHRSAEVYVVPRRFGPQAGTALIGATVEDVGFDTRVEEEALLALRERAAKLVPELGDAELTPQVEAWAGLRPGTEDGLPVMGAVPGTRRQFVAGGHFRNGILLAPATAVAMAAMMEGRAGAVDVRAFGVRSIAHAGR